MKRTIEDRQGFGDFIKQNFGYEKKKRSNKVKMRWNDVVSIGVLPSLDDYSSLSEKEEARRKERKEMEEFEAAEKLRLAEEEQKDLTSILVIPASRHEATARLNSRGASARPKSVRWSDESAATTTEEIEIPQLTTNQSEPKKEMRQGRMSPPSAGMDIPSLRTTQSNPEKQRQGRMSSPSTAMKSELSVVSLESIPCQTPAAWTESPNYPSASKRQAKLQMPTFSSMMAKNERLKEEKAKRNEKNDAWVNEYVESWGFRTPSPRSTPSDTSDSNISDDADEESESEEEPVKKSKPSEIYTLKTEINRLQSLMLKAKQKRNATKFPNVGLRKVLRTVEKGTPYTRREKPMRVNKYSLQRVQEENKDGCWTSRPQSRTERERERWSREEAPSRSGGRQGTGIQV